MRQRRRPIWKGSVKANKVATRKPIQADDVTESSGNVFADLGLPNADQELNKARLRLESAGKRRE